MTESREPDADKVPDDEELQEPSTEKEPEVRARRTEAGTDEVKRDTVDAPE